MLSYLSETLGASEAALRLLLSVILGKREEACEKFPLSIFISRLLLIFLFLHTFFFSFPACSIHSLSYRNFLSPVPAQQCEHYEKGDSFVIYRQRHIDLSLQLWLRGSTLDSKCNIHLYHY